VAKAWRGSGEEEEARDVALESSRMASRSASSGIMPRRILGEHLKKTQAKAASRGIETSLSGIVSAAKDK